MTEDRAALNIRNSVGASRTYESETLLKNFRDFSLHNGNGLVIRFERNRTGIESDRRLSKRNYTLDSPTCSLSVGCQIVQNSSATGRQNPGMTDSEHEDSSENEKTQVDKEEQLLRAARSGKHEEIENILERNPTLDVNCKGKNKWNLNWTPLHLSSYFGHIQATRVLLKRGANPSEQNAEGDTPLHKAALTNRESLVTLLLTQGAEIFVKNHEGRTAHGVASELYIRNVLSAAEIADKERKKARFFQAVKDGDHALLQQILTDTSNGAIPDVNSVDVVGNTALHSAARRDLRAIAIILLQCGADPNLKNRIGVRSIDLAHSEQMKSILGVAPIEEIKKNVSRFEGAVVRKKKLLRNQTLWAVMDRGVLSFFRSRADASTGTNRKTFRYLEKAIVVPDPRDERSFSVVLSDGCSERLSVANALDRNKWIKSFRDHIDFGAGNPDTGSRNGANSSQTLGCIEDALSTAQAQQQLLSSEISETAKLHTTYLATSFESGDYSLKAQNVSQELRTRLQQVSGLAEATLKCLESCLLLMKQQEQSRSSLLEKEIQKNRMLRETLEAFAVEADNAQFVKPVLIEKDTSDKTDALPTLEELSISTTLQKLTSSDDSWQSADS